MDSIPAYLGLTTKKQKEIQEQGYSLIHTLKNI